MLKRGFDIFFSFLGILFLLPLFLVLSFLIGISSPGGVFYRQKRVGKNGKDFFLIKFRTMKTGSDQKGLLTVGGKDSRITGIGYYLRKYKLDELPQLINVLLGEMSLVGPRPEVRKYVNLYDEQQLQVLTLRPGITDYASLNYFDENEILGKAFNPEEVYIKKIMPHKLSLNLKYIQERSFWIDVVIIFRTVGRIFK